LWLFLGITIMLPAWVVIGYWFGFNVFNLYAVLGLQGQDEVGGVALFAHVGGFLVGLLSIRAAVSGRPPAPQGRWGSLRPSRKNEGPWTRSPRSWY